MSYWVGGSGNWSDAANHWAATSGGAPGAGNLPDSTKDAIFDANSNATAYTVTVDATANCKDLNFAAAPSASGTVTFAPSGNRTINVYGHVTLLAGMNFTFSNNISLTGAVTHNFTSNGAAITAATQIIVATAGGSLVLQDALNMSHVGSNINIFVGDFDTQGFNVTTGYILISSTGNITLGTSVITLNVTTGSNAWTCPAGATFSGASSEIVIAAPLSGFSGGGKTYGTVRWTAYGYTLASIQGANTFTNLSITGSAAKTNTMGLGATQTVTGTLTLTGNSAINRLFIKSSTPGVTATISAAAVSLANVDFMDIAGTGAAAPFTGTSLGDCLGNSGITMTASETQTATGTASFTWSTHGWTTRVPLPQDDVVIPNAFVAGRRITMDMPRMGRNITFTCTGGVEFFPGVTGNTMYGSLTMNSGVIPTSGSQNLVFAGRSACTLTNAGFVWPIAFALQMPGGKLTLQDALVSTLASSGFTITYGELDLNGFTATFAGRVLINGGTLTFGTGTLIVQSPSGGDALGYAWSSGTVSAANGTLKIANPRASGFNELNIGSFSYGTVWISGTNYGPVRINNSYDATIGTFKSDNPNCHIFFGVGRTQTIGTWDVNGTAPGAEKYINFILANLAGNNVTTPDSAAADITGDIAIVTKVLLTDWSLGIDQMIISKMQASGQYSYQLFILATGHLYFRFSLDGTTLSTSSQQSSAIPSFTDQTYQWIAVTRNATTGDVKYWTSSDGAAWTQFGTTRTGSAGNLFSSTSIVEVGSQVNGNASNIPNGRMRRTMIFNGIPPMLGGAASASPVLDCNAADYSSGRTWVSATGETWTLNGATVVLADNLIHIGSASDAAHTLTKSGSGIISARYLSIRRSGATPANTWYAANSVDQGQNTGWIFGGRLIADAGSFALTGYDAQFYRGYAITLSAGAFTVSGQAALLNYLSPNPLYTIEATARDFTVTGNRNFRISK